MAFWAAARLEPRREQLALHCLGFNGYQTYLPRIRECCVVRRRRIEVHPPLFPGYAFVAIELQWHTARWAFGVLDLIMDGIPPARVPDSVIAEIRGREQDGFVELPKLPKPRVIHPGDKVRITGGLFQGKLGLCAGMRSGERVEVLLALLGRATLPRNDVARV